jgi:hypothetical protein
MLLFLAAVCVQARVDSNQRLPFSLHVDIPCTGDLVRLEGYIHVVVSSTRDSTGGLKLRSHVNPEGVSGTSLLGVLYQGTGVTRDHFNVKPPFPQSFTHINRFRVVGQGSRNDFIAFMTMHYTINANGETTADILDMWSSCGTGG